MNRNRTFPQKSSAFMMVNSALFFPITLQNYAQIQFFQATSEKENNNMFSNICHLFFFFLFVREVKIFCSFACHRGKNACCIFFLLSFLCQSTVPLRETTGSLFVTAWGYTFPEPGHVMNDSERLLDSLRTCLY